MRGDLLGSAVRRARLAWWLGPWSGSAHPLHVQRRAVLLDDSGPSYLYEPVEPTTDRSTTRRAQVAWLISPGLHYAGPDDPRMHRLASVLAATGAIVLSPRSAELCQLRIGQGAISSLERARAFLAAHPAAAGLPMNVLSVSVGALAAMRLATSPVSGPSISRVVVIGGYADPRALIASLCGAGDAPHDPLNQAAAFLTFLEGIETPSCPIADRRRLVAAWRRFIRIVWAQPAWKQPGSTAHHGVAFELQREVAAADRPLFLTGCGALPGGHALVAAAQRSGAFDTLDWRPHAAALCATAGGKGGPEVIAIHGEGDTVIPISQLDAFAAAVPAARTIRLGSFAHSSAISLSTLGNLLGDLPRLAGEARAFGQVLRAVA